MVNPAKIFLTANLINMQNLVAVSPIVCAHVGGPKDLGGTLGPRPLGWGMADRVEIRPFPACHFAKCGRSRSNSTSVITEIRQKSSPPAFQGESRSPEPT